MEKIITEVELIEIIGHDNYVEFIHDVYNLIKKSDAYKSNDDAVFYIGATPLNDTSWFHYEATVNKIGLGDDFGFTRMLITDDLDFTLDRVNEAKKIINGEFFTIK
jgi:hypothetical protein